MPKIDDQIRALQEALRDGIEVSEAGLKTHALALLQLAIVQTYLLEMQKSEGPGGCSSKAFELVAEAIKVLDDYETPTGH